MQDHVNGKAIVVTGAGAGFGRLVSYKAAARGASIICGDIDGAAAEATAAAITAGGGQARALAADVTSFEQVLALVEASMESHGAIDVMVNNAGIMPLGFFSDHVNALLAWQRCIDINIKGVLHGMIAAHDPMIAAGRGHVVNISSIYGNFPVVGAAVYGASKVAVNFLSESFRLETRGKIKVTTVKPTGVPGTSLNDTVINPSASAGIVGHFGPDFSEFVAARERGAVPREYGNADDPAYFPLAPDHIADAVMHAIDQPWGVSIGDITVRASGDYFAL